MLLIHCFILKYSLKKSHVDQLQSTLKGYDSLTDFKFKTKNPSSLTGFAFAGFENKDTAKEIIEKLDGSILNNQKLQIENALDIYDSNRPDAVNKVNIVGKIMKSRLDYVKRVILNVKFSLR